MPGSINSSPTTSNSTVASAPVSRTQQDGHETFKNIFTDRNTKSRIKPKVTESTVSASVHEPKQALFDTAKMAANYSRISLPLKASNKDYGDDDSAVPKEKVSNYSLKHLQIRWDSRKKIRELRLKLCYLFGTLINPEVDARLTRRHGDKASGVCDDYACLVYEFLRENLPLNVSHDMVCLKKPGTHVFNVINPPKKNADGSYPKDFSKWPKEAIIVDGWANIICSPETFEKKWNDKMQKWDNRHLKINDDSPLDKQWFNAVSVFEKESWFAKQKRIDEPTHLITINRSLLNKYLVEPPLD